jgi:L-2-hydroxyglutarate oxidase
MYDIVVIGGGIVGLSTAYHLKLKKPDIKIALLEKEGALAAHQTGHNSGVIHSGIYYKPGSLKAKNCISGYHKLLKFCDEEQIKYDLCGKVIVATSTAEFNMLDDIMQRGKANGLDGLRLINKEEIKSIEPHVAGEKGIFVPQTGIIDYTEVCEKLGAKFKSLGGEIFLHHKVTAINSKTNHKEIITDKEPFATKFVVSCGGLHSDKVAKMTNPDIDVKIIPFRGEYYKIKEEKKYLVKNLVYPVPDPNFPFLGVHFTRMINGDVEAGPNAVLAFKREGYNKTDINLSELAETLAWPGFRKVAMKYWKTGMGEFYRSFSKDAFTKALQKLVPEIQADDLTPAEAGVRAQACDRTGGLLDDFMILEGDRSVHVCNAPSPAATSSLAIGDTVSDLALKAF